MGLDEVGLADLFSHGEVELHAGIPVAQADGGQPHGKGAAHLGLRIYTLQTKDTRIIASRKPLKSAAARNRRGKQRPSNGTQFFRRDHGGGAGDRCGARPRNGLKNIARHPGQAENSSSGENARFRRNPGPHDPEKLEENFAPPARDLQEMNWIFRTSAEREFAFTGSLRGISAVFTPGAATHWQPRRLRSRSNGGGCCEILRKFRGAKRGRFGRKTGSNFENDPAPPGLPQHMQLAVCGPPAPPQA